jgi:2-keto-3-deoxy-L-rhamnonate aldolase RhmA
MRGSERPLKERWHAGETTLGVWSVLPGAMGPESLARQGFPMISISVTTDFVTFESVQKEVPHAS